MYALVVQWTTVILIITIDIFLGLKSKQICVADAFLHAYVGEGEIFYINIPKGFDQYYKTGCNKFLNKKKTLYGIFQS